MRDSDERLRRIFCAKQEHDTNHLIGALKDPEHRHMAAKFVADLGATEAIPALEVLLNAKDATARFSAAIALGRLRAMSARARLLELARDDPSPVTRAWAIAALGAIGGEEALSTIVGFLDDENWTVRRGAVFALSVLGDPAALAPLDRAWRRESRLRRAAYRKARRQIENGEEVALDSESAFEKAAHIVVAGSEPSPRKQT